MNKKDNTNRYFHFGEYMKKGYWLIGAFLFMLALAIIFAQTAATPAFASAEAGFGLASDNIVFYEAEEHNYLYLTANESFFNNVSLPTTVGYRMGESSSALYGVNYTTATEGDAVVDLVNGQLCIIIDSIFQAAYDGDKYADIEIFAVDESYCIFEDSATARLSIRDKNPDGYVAIVSEDKIVFENQGNVSYTVQCSPNFFGVTVGLSYYGSAVRNSEYTAPDSIFIPSGETLAEVTLQLLDNNTKQNRGRDIIAAITSVTKGAEIAAIPNNTSITLKDDESMGVVSFSAGTATVREFDGDYAVLIERKDGTEGDLVFDLEMTSTAVLDEQYKNNPSGEYTLYDGEASKIIRLKLSEDGVYTGNQTFTFKLKQKQGGKVVFGTDTLVLTRKDSIPPSTLCFSAGRFNDTATYGSQILRTDGYVYADTYEISVNKSSGGRVSFKASASISGSYMNCAAAKACVKRMLGSFPIDEEITVSSESFDEEGVFLYNLSLVLPMPNESDPYLGDVTITLHFYDFNGETTMEGVTDYSVDILLSDSAENGSYSLGEITRGDNELTFRVWADSPCQSRTVNGYVEFLYNENSLYVQNLEFSTLTKSVYCSFPLVSDTYDVFRDNYQTVTVKLVMTTGGAVVRDAQKTVDITRGAGGIVYFGDNHESYPRLTAREGNTYAVQLMRDAWNNLPQLSVPLYVQKADTFFTDISQPVAVAIFPEGELTAYAELTIPSDGVFVYSINIMYFKTDAHDYTTKSQNSARKWLDLHNSEDYGKVGFDYADYSARVTEGEEIKLKIKKSGGVDTPLDFYVADTNLPNVITLPRVTVTKEGAELAFTYDDDVWTDYMTERRYITIKMIAPCGDVAVNTAGLLNGADTFTVWVKENEKLCELTAEVTEGAVLDVENAKITVTENSPEVGKFDLVFSVNMFTKSFSTLYNLEDIFQVYSVTPEGEEIITAISTTVAGRDADYSHRYTVSIPFAYSHLQKDISFTLCILPVRTDVMVKTGFSSFEVTVKNKSVTSQIKVSTPTLKVLENVGGIDFTLECVNTLEEDKSFTLASMVGLAERIGTYKIKLDGEELKENSFVWKRADEDKTKQLRIEWTDNGVYNENQEQTFTLALAAERCLANPLIFSVPDDEISSSLRFALPNTPQNPIVLFSNKENGVGLENDGFELDVSEFSVENLDVSFELIPIDAPADTELNGVFCDRFIFNGKYWGAYFGYKCVSAEWFASASYKLVLRGCNYNVKITEDNLAQRTVYFEVRSMAGSADFSFSKMPYERADTAEIITVSKGNIFVDVLAEYSLSTQAIESGFTLSANSLFISATPQSESKIILVSPAVSGGVNKIAITANYTYSVNGTQISSDTVIHEVTVLSEDRYAFGWKQASLSINEGAQAVLTVTRGSAARSGSVDYAVSALDSRVEGASGTLNFAVGELSKELTVLCLDDSIVNAKNAFTVTLSNPVGGANAVDTAVVTVNVIDYDCALSSISPISFSESFMFYVWGDFDADGFADLAGMLEDGTVVFYFNNLGSFEKKVCPKKMNPDCKMDSIIYLGKEHLLVCSAYNICTVDVKADRTMSFANFSVNYAFSADTQMVVCGPGFEQIYFVDPSNKGSLLRYQVDIMQNGEAIIYERYTEAYVDKVAIVYEGFDSQIIIDRLAVSENNELIVVGKPRNNEDYTTTAYMVGNRGYYCSSPTYFSPEFISFVYPYQESHLVMGKDSTSLVKYSLENGDFEYRLRKSGANNGTDMFNFPKNVSVLQCFGINLTSGNEYAVLMDGKLYILSKGNSDSAYRLSSALAEGVTQISRFDMFANGKSSISYVKDGKVNYLENPYNLSVIGFADVSQQVLDTDSFVEFAVTRAGSVNRTHSVTVRTLDDTAVNGIDYTAINVEVTFLPKELTKIIRVYLKDTQNFPTDRKTALVQIVSNNGSVVLRQSIFYIQIQDTDRSGNVYFSGDTSFEEGTTAKIALMRDRPSAYGLSVDYAITGNSCVQEGKDILCAATGSVTFGEGEYLKYIEVELVDDDVCNILYGKAPVDRFFNITISNPQGVGFDYSLYPNHAPLIVGDSEKKISVIDDESLFEAIDATDKGALDGDILNPSGNAVLGNAIGNNRELASTVLDFDKNGRADEYTFANGILQIRLNCGFDDASAVTYTLAQLLELYGKTPKGNENCFYVAKLNRFVLTLPFQNTYLEFNTVQTVGGVALTSRGIPCILGNPDFAESSFNTPTSNFEISSVLTSGNIAFGDFDDDGNTDLFWLHYDSPKSDAVYALSSDGYKLKKKQTLEIMKNAPSTYGMYCSFYVYDANNDGRDDIAIAHRYASVYAQSSRDYCTVYFAINTVDGLGDFVKYNYIANSVDIRFIRMNDSASALMVQVCDFSDFINVFQIKGTTVTRCCELGLSRYWHDWDTKIIRSRLMEITTTFYQAAETGDIYVHLYAEGLCDEYRLVNLSLDIVNVANAVVAENSDYIDIPVYNVGGKAGSVRYYTTNGTAVAGDYRAVNGTLYFEQGEFVKTVRIYLLDNDYSDGEKYFHFIIDSNGTRQVGYNTSKVTITDDESMDALTRLPSVFFVGTDYELTASEDAVSRVVLVDSLGNTSSALGKKITTNFAKAGSSDITLYGFDSNGMRVYFYSITVNAFAENNPVVLTVSLPKKVTEGTTVDVSFYYRLESNGAEFPIYDAKMEFFDPMKGETAFVYTGINGVATYPMSIEGGEYGNFTLSVQAFSHLQTASANTVFRLDNPDAKISGYVLLPDGNIGASDITVCVDGVSAKTDQNGAFTLELTSGYTYTLVVNPQRENRFYGESKLEVLHNKTNSIVSVALQYAAEDILEMALHSFSYNYTGNSYTRETWTSELGNVKYSLPVENNKYVYADLRMENRFSNSGELPDYTIDYPQNGNWINTGFARGELVESSFMWVDSYMDWDWNWYRAFCSRTELYFCIPDGAAARSYYQDLEFVVCDREGNTLRVLDRVDYSNVGLNKENAHWIPPSEQKQELANHGYGNLISYYDYMIPVHNYIKVSIYCNEVNEDERLYIRRISNNDVFYYYTGVAFGRSLAEKTRDDVAEKFAQVDTNEIPATMAFLKDTVFGIDISSTEYTMDVFHGENKAVVYLGFATRSRNLSEVPKGYSSFVGIMTPPAKKSVMVTHRNKVQVYFGGIMVMRYNNSSRKWVYESGDAIFYGMEETKTRITFSYSIVFGLSALVYTQVGMELESNISVSVNNGELNLEGDCEGSFSIEVGGGISVVLASAELWFNAAGAFNLYFGEVSGSKMKVVLSGGMTVYFLWFKYRETWWKVTYEYSEVYKPPVVELEETTLADVAANDFSAYCVEVDENGILHGTIKDVRETEITTIVEETVVDATPSIVDFGGKTMSIYKQTVKNASGLTYESLFYTVKADGVWQSPKPVTAIVRDISEFSVTVYNGTPVIAFTHTSVGDSLTEQLQNVNLSVAFYQPEGDRFSVQSITNDNLPESKPVVASDGDRLLLVYSKAYRLEYTMDMTLADALFNERELNYTMYSVFNTMANRFAEPKVMMRGAYNIKQCDMTVIDGTAFYVYLADMDGSVSTEEDVEAMCNTYSFTEDLWSQADNLSNNAVGEMRIKVLNTSGRLVYLWLNKYGINIKLGEAESSVINTKEKGDITYFTAKSLGSDIIIAWTEATVNVESSKSEYLYFLLADLEGNVGIRKVLTSSENVILDYDILAQENSVYVVHNDSAQNADGNNKYSLIGTEVAYLADAGVENVYTASGRFRTNADEVVFFDVVNTGVYALNNVRVVVRENNQSGTFLHTAVITSLKRGEVRTLSFTCRVSAAMYGLFITVEQDQQQAAPLSAKTCVFAFSATQRGGAAYLSDGEVSGINMRNELVNLVGVDSFSVNGKARLIVRLENVGDLASTGSVRIKEYLSGTEWLKIISYDFAAGEALDIVAEFDFTELAAYASENKNVMLLVSLASDTATFQTYTATCMVNLQRSYLIKLNNGEEVNEYYANGMLAKPDDAEKQGFIFGGWYMDEACTQAVVLPLELTSDITLYAKWIPIQEGREQEDGSFILKLALAIACALLLVAAVLAIVALRVKKRGQSKLMLSAEGKADAQALEKKAETQNGAIDKESGQTQTPQKEEQTEISKQESITQAATQESSNKGEDKNKNTIITTQDNPTIDADKNGKDQVFEKENTVITDEKDEQNKIITEDGQTAAEDGINQASQTKKTEE